MRGQPQYELNPVPARLACACFADMNVRLVLVLGVRRQMDRLLAARGLEPHYVDGYRVTDMDVMTAAAEATGAARVEVEAALSKVSSKLRHSPCSFDDYCRLDRADEWKTTSSGVVLAQALSTQVLRRHNRSSDGIRHGPPVEVRGKAGTVLCDEMKPEDRNLFCWTSPPSLLVHTLMVVSLPWELVACVCGGPQLVVMHSRWCMATGSMASGEAWLGVSTMATPAKSAH